MEFLPIEKENIEIRPDKLAVNLSGEQLIFRVSWNVVAEAFFFDLFDKEGDYILSGRKIIYGYNMLDNIPDERVPDVSITPLDPSGEEDNIGITFGNFMNDVKPWITIAGDE